MKTTHVYVWKKRRTMQWTPELDRLLGTLPDAEIAVQIGFSQMVPIRRRKALGIPTYRSSRAPTDLLCANCAKGMKRKLRDYQRSKRLFCSKECANSGQKRRDMEMLRYGAGWKNRRAEIRQRDQVCQACGKTPEMNGATLQVHHLKPFRAAGTNRPANLVALCDTCHHRIESITTQILDSIQIEVRLDAPFLTITVEGKQRWHGFVAGVDSQIPLGSHHSMDLVQP